MVAFLGGLIQSRWAKLSLVLVLGLLAVGCTTQNRPCRLKTGTTGDENALALVGAQGRVIMVPRARLRI